MEPLESKLAKLLYVRFCTIFGDKFIKSYHSEEFQNAWYEDWSIGLAGIKPETIKLALDHLRLNCEWPPVLAEFRKICEGLEGLPTLEHALQSAIRREFDHPVIKLTFDKVGSWDMKNGKDEALRKKFDAAYREALAVYRVNPDNAWKALEEFKVLPPPVELPSKIPSAEERIGFKERMKQYATMAEAEKAKLKPTDHPVWDAAAINVHSDKFDQKIYEERRKYLTGLDETLSMTLSREDQYDRIRLLREDIARRHVESLRDGSYVPPKEKTSPRSFHGAKVVYKNWMGD